MKWLQALLAVGIINFKIESVYVPGADEAPVSWCAWVEDLEVTRYRLADPRPILSFIQL